MKSGAVMFFHIMGWVTVALSIVVLGCHVMEMDSYDFERMDQLLLTVILPLLIVIGMGVCVPLAALKRSNAARWTFFGLALLLLFTSILFMFGPMGPRSDVEATLTFLQWAALVAALVVSLLPGMNAWVARRAYDPYGRHAPPQPGFAPTAGQGHSYPRPAHMAGFPAAPATGGTRACPHCAEQIRMEASKCRFCGSDVTPLA